MKCKDCIMFDVDHYDMYEEPICSMGNFVIRLKHGQGKPDNCPFRLKKEQEAVKPHYNARTNWYECGACHYSMTSGMHCRSELIPAYKVGFCAKCGKAVKWDDI